MSRFSIGSCRNLGATIASSNIITFLDLDYFLSIKQLNNLLELIKIKNIDINPREFIILPTVFLNEKSNNVFDFKNWDERQELIIQNDLITGKNQYIKFFAKVGSSIVCNRHKYLEMGGNDPVFEGHGYEDFDFLYRMIKSNAIYDKLPSNLDYDNRSWNFISYNGFRALFSVLGYEMAFFGLYVYHINHPEPNNDGYLDLREKNHQLFYDRLKKYKIIEDGPNPILLSQVKDQKSVIFTADKGSVYRSIRGIRPYIGDVFCKTELEFFTNDFFDEKLLKSFIIENDIKYFIFPNPYGNEKRTIIYKYLRKNNIKYIAYDRGALPDSWFFDTNGFNYDSSSYDEKNWNFKLSDEQTKKALDYISSLNESQDRLEKQGKRIGVEQFRSKYGLNDKKVIFIPLQVETDTVIKYFTRKPFDYIGFLETVNNIAKELEKKNIIFVAKKHPLYKNIDNNKYMNIKFIDDAHIDDLIDVSFCVLLINSGVGLQAMIRKKPCLIAGNAFYYIKGVNYEVHSQDEIKKYILSEDLSVDYDKVIRFVYYLVYKFYSFGKSYYTEKQGDNGITRRYVNYIDFYRINIDGVCYLDLEKVESKRISHSSLSFIPYLFQSKQKNQSVEQKEFLHKKDLRRKKLKKLIKHPYLYIRDGIKKIH